ncbi:hypothetical protein LHFGNBLO_002069 [Mesorhizobium sp. AR10]|uniref:hypothetical protein n=1 Tax=Mesorhizobium sp. AR10 TaxID=2865839 RepID=UPI00215DF7FC|nr:hypothetical protein [Mesorhizobium sp. AR10]UVK40584.1 hypothetical protein LHFGNBLO_002069 [Mesorhizobium sp. AR10]
MASESDRIARAGDYVLGLMNDRDRERAERDLEIDSDFRDAVVQLAERMHVFDRAGPAGVQPDNRWELITQRIAELPQMRMAGLDSSDVRPPAVIRSLDQPPYGVGLHAPGGRRGTIIAIGLIAAFALGYLAGKF